MAAPVEPIMPPTYRIRYSLKPSGQQHPAATVETVDLEADLDQVPGLLPPAQAYAGFANGTILLIVLAFLVARAVVKCGLGTRVGHAVVSVFGRSTLGLSYSIFLVDAVIAPRMVAPDQSHYRGAL